MINGLKLTKGFYLINEIIDKDNIGINFEGNLKFKLVPVIKNMFLEKIISLFLFNEKNLLILINDYKDIEALSVIDKLGNKIIKLNLREDDLKAKLEYEINNLKDSTGRTFINKVNLLSRKLKNDISKIADINNFFYNKKDISLSDLYLKAKYKITKDSNCYKDYYIYRIKRSMIKGSFFDLNKAQNEVINNRSYEKYIKYRRYVDNTKLKILKDNIGNIEFYIEKIKEIIKKDSIKISYEETKYTKDFLKSYLHNPNMNNYDITNISSLINIKYNSSILNEDDKGSFKKYIFKRKYEEERLNKEREFQEYQDTIEKEIINLKDTLDKQLKKYNFINEILVDKESKDLVNDLINGYNVKDKFEIIYNLLIVKRNLLLLKDEIYEYDNVTLSLLKYSYENIENRQNVVDLISNLDVFKANYEIEKKELSNINIENYKIYDDIIEEILKARSLIEEYMYNSLNYVWENKIREELKVNNGSYINLEDNYSDAYKSLFPIYVGLKSEMTFEEISRFKNIISLEEDGISLYKDYNKEVKIKEDFDLKYEDYYKFNEEGYYSNILLSYLNENYKNIEVNYKLEGINLPIFINNINSYAIIVEENTKDFNLNNELYIHAKLKEKNIEIIRVWLRDLWSDKNSVFNNIKEIIK